MIVTCASCMTKFSLDESKIPAKGAKVRCSKCQHVFFVVPPTEPPPEPPTEPPIESKEEEPMEDFESFIKSQEEFAEPGPKGPEIPPSKMDKREEIGFPGEKEEIGFPEEEEALFREEAPAKRVAPVTPFEPEAEERAEAKPVKPKRMVQREKRRPPVVFLLIIFLVLLVLGGFFLWTEFGSKETVTTYLEYPVQKAKALWDQMLGVKQEGLVVGDLNRYDEKVGDFFLSVIEGKVKNQSQSARKYIKIRVEIYDQHKDKITEKETFCGLNIGLDGLKSLPPEFFKGEMLIQPQQQKDMVIPTGQETPFMVVFKDLTSQAREFKVDIIEAPNL
ncbi:MAG TPA: DUF3426 domain-containing protein [Thermodesulfobacteriota bacterium]|nr:DUF3426 domain-containing protein [Thermodesulfobacteriota bacterium]